MNAQDEILQIEKRLWTGGADDYRRHVDDKCLLAFTATAGVMTREQVVASVQDAARWRDLTIEAVSSLALAADVQLLNYRAEANRPNGQHYKALVSSAYVRRGREWKLAFHQQTPLD
jgi:hypothetical protein